jgi:hypothetical protein
VTCRNQPTRRWPCPSWWTTSSGPSIPQSLFPPVRQKRNESFFFQWLFLCRRRKELVNSNSANINAQRMLFFDAHTPFSYCFKLTELFFTTSVKVNLNKANPLTLSLRCVWALLKRLIRWFAFSKEEFWISIIFDWSKRILLFISKYKVSQKDVYVIGKTKIQGN